MRWLAGLTLLLAALVALVWIVTGSAREADPLARSAAVEREYAGAPQRARSGLLDAQSAANATSERDSGPEAVAASARTPSRRGPSSIRGRVRRANGDPAGRTFVGLFAPAARDDGATSPFAAVFAGNDALREYLRIVRIWTQADDAGEFVFDDPDPGTWIVRAEDGPLLAAATEPFALELGASRAGIEIMLPPEAWLEGHVILPPGGTMPSSCLELRANAAFSIARWMPTAADIVESVRCVPDEELRFRLGPVETGLFTVGIVVDRELERRGRPAPTAGDVVPILDLYLGEGVTQRDLDVRAGLPGSIGLVLDLGAFEPRPPPGQRVFAPVKGVRITALPWEGAQRVFAVQANVAVGDPIELGPLAVGSWQLTAQFPGDGPWTWMLGDPVRVEAARRTEIRFSLEVARYTLTLLDATSGGLLAGAVELGSDESGGGIVVHHNLSVPGQLELALPPGEYRLTAREEGLDELVDDPNGWVRLVWDASGPRTTTLRVPR